MSNAIKSEFHPDTIVVFRNLLEDEADDICCGILRDDGYIDCLCGCNGGFEPEDVDIIGEICHEYDISQCLSPDVLESIFDYISEKEV